MANTPKVEGVGVISTVKGLEIAAVTTITIVSLFQYYVDMSY